MFLLLFQRMEHKMHFKVNLDDIDKSVMTVCIGSARGYGQTPSGVPWIIGCFSRVASGNQPDGGSFMDAFSWALFES